MIRWLLIGFLVAHGLVHIAVWGSSKSVTPIGTHPHHSWLIGDQRRLAFALMAVSVTLFALAGVGLMFQVGWWGPMTVVAAVSSLVLIAVFPAAILNGWLVAPFAINAGLIVGILWLHWPTRAAFGG